MPLRKIRLEMARTPEFPMGSANHGYDFVAPLTEDGHFDPDEWRKARTKCTVRRFWPRDKPFPARRRDRGRATAFFGR